MSKKVCFLVTEHPFLDARIFKKEAKSLRKHGYQVTMIVPRKNGYLFDVNGSVFKDRFLEPFFYHEGIKIITYEQIFPEKNIKNLHFNLHSGKFTRFTDPLTKLGIEQEADIYHAHEFFSLCCGIGIKRALASKGKTCKLIYDSHELEPDPLGKQSQKSTNIKQQILELMLTELDYVLTVSESIKSWYQSIDPTVRVEVIYNSPPLAPNPVKKNTTDIVIAYEGTISQHRGNFPKLMEILNLSNKLFKLNVKIIGGVKNSTKSFTLSIPDHLKDRIHFTGWVDYEKIPESMENVDIGWVDLDAVESLNNRFAMPNKFFSYLTNGVPVLVNQCTDMEKFIERYNCGYVVKKRKANAQDYVDALFYLHSNSDKFKNMSQNARRVMETTYSWEQMEKRLLKVYHKLTSNE